MTHDSIGKNLRAEVRLSRSGPPIVSNAPLLATSQEELIAIENSFRRSRTYGSRSSGTSGSIRPPAPTGRKSSAIYNGTFRLPDRSPNPAARGK